MKPRTIVTGFLAGMIICVPLWLIMHDSWSLRLEKGAPSPSLLEIIAWLFILFFLPFVGYISAKWNWSETRMDYVMDGGNTGLITGCMTYTLIGSAGMGIMGNRAVMHTPADYVASQQMGVNYVFSAVVSTSYWVYLGFWGFLLAGWVFGAVGGLLAQKYDPHGLGKKPAQKAEWLFRLPFYLFVFSGYFHYALSVAFFNEFSKALEAGLSKATDLPPDLLMTGNETLFLSLTTSLLMVFIPLAITLGWILAGWKYKRFRVFYYLWLFLVLAATICNTAYTKLDLARYFVGMIFMSLVIFSTWQMAKISVRPFPPEKYSFGDWISFFLAQGVLGGTQAFIGIFPFTLSLTLLTISNIPGLFDMGEVIDNIPTQFQNIFSILFYAGAGLMVLSGIGGLLVGLLVLFTRKFFFYDEFFNSQNIEEEWKKTAENNTDLDFEKPNIL